MQIQKIQSNQTTFGTKVRISSILTELYSKKDGGIKLQKYINELQNNKVNDILSITHVQDKTSGTRIVIDVFEKKNQKILKGGTLVLPLPKTKKPACLNLVEIYKELASGKKALKIF